jgi:hypothetical protein
MFSFEEPLNVTKIMNNFDMSWSIAGGWAISIFIGYEIRKHKDIEIAILRRDQLALQRYLKNWEFKKVIPDTGEMEIWKNGEYLELPVHEIHAYNINYDPSALEILLNESNENEWVFRRNPEISRPKSKLGIQSKMRIPILSPEIILLYKAKNPNNQDETDFNTIYKLLNKEQRNWLKESIKICYPEHPWLDIL